MKFHKTLLGLGAGFAAGYLAVRTLEAIDEWWHPASIKPRDAQTYGSVRRALDLAETVRGTAGFLAFAYGPLGEAADRATSRAPAWLRPALYVIPLSLISALLELPASFVQDYTLERRYGLSDQTRDSWLKDYGKGALLSTGLTALVATLFGTALRHAPKRWPLIASLGVLPLFVLAHVVVPIYVLPLFNTFEPVTGPLEERLRRLAERFGVGEAAILRMDMSKQSRKANAFVTGIGRTHRIVLGDTLIEGFPEEEIEFVVAHELGHYVAKDTWRTIGLGEALASVLFLVAKAATPEHERDALRARPLLIARLYATMLIATQALRPILFAYSRSREWAADRFALSATHNPQTGASAFRRLRDQNLAEEDLPAWYELFFSSHPSLKARIDAIEQALTT